MAISDYNPVFDDPTPARAPAADDKPAPQEKPATPPTDTQKPPRQGKPLRGRRDAEVPAELGEDALGDWRWRLGASARKAAADRRRANASLHAWESLAAEARSAGVPDRMLLAAALEADIELPRAT
jgi:hypothetical protein